MALPSRPLVSMDERGSHRPRHSVTLRSLRPCHQRRHKSRVLLRDLHCALSVSGIHYGEVYDTHAYQTESMSLSTILLIVTPIIKLPFFMVRHCIYLRVRSPQCIIKFGIVPKVSILSDMLATLDLSSKDLTYIKPTYFGTLLGCPSFWTSFVRLH
jgi:hypothetical protein